MRKLVSLGLGLLLILLCIGCMASVFLGWNNVGPMVQTFILGASSIFLALLVLSVIIVAVFLSIAVPWLLKNF